MDHGNSLQFHTLSLLNYFESDEEMSPEIYLIASNGLRCDIPEDMLCLSRLIYHLQSSLAGYQSTQHDA